MHQTADSAPRRKLSDIFSKDEIALLTARSDWMGWRALLFTWGVTGLAFVALARWPHPLTWLVVLVILGGRQLSLAIMMHDAAHGTLFKTRWLNEVLADYACGSAVGIDIRRYRQHHLVHHSKTGTEADTAAACRRRSRPPAPRWPANSCATCRASPASSANMVWC